MKKKELIARLIKFVGEVADQYGEYEIKPFHEYTGDIDQLSARAQDLLEEIENA